MPLLMKRKKTSSISTESVKMLGEDTVEWDNVPNLSPRHMK